MSRDSEVRPSNRASSRSSDSAQAAFIWQVRVYFEDTDAGGVVYHSNYLRYLERARSEWLRTFGFDHGQLRREHTLLFVARSVTIKFVKPALLDDLLTVSVMPERFSPYQIVFAQSVMRAGGENVAENEAANEEVADEEVVRARVSVACVDSITFKPKAMPDSLIAMLQNNQ